MDAQIRSQRSEDAIVIPTQREFKQPISKKPRNSETPPSDRPKRPNCLFFKTRLCLRFTSGNCANGLNCTFAHGSQELRAPLPSWQEFVPEGGSMNQEQLVLKNRICKMFYRGDVCTYGEKCTFAHVEPGMLGDNVNSSKRDSSALEPGKDLEGIVVLGSGSGSVRKQTFWKTRMCNKWEVLGYCPFGEGCHFAHGLAELMDFKNQKELDNPNTTAATLKPPLHQAKLVSSSTTSSVKHQSRGFLKWKGLEKISRIYGDWIDDIPF
ncbi:uncharacterized protein A4U43_C06F8990 [Asparagus officinalis]|uniref:C3H1-type domain-containing protein n=1 Tax=Asparagus officinalis TaxID=4686 RepID=A0A5P1EKJ3_ASPOF|nr:zinc finger CCCH domain-containing protein 12-like [Asparagus officinalis]ONK66515.1 uncharacterized protein A4U43_C06F8990 [Asparagus officinalis]